MFSYELKFLTTDQSLHIKNTDPKTRKYETKKKQEQSVYDLGKKSYCERRGEKWSAPRQRQLRELETLMRDRNIVFCEWTNDSLITIVFSSGILTYLSVNPDNLEITQILFDKYCVGKLSGQAVTSVVLSRSHLLFLHTDGGATLITFSCTSSSTPTRISDRSPHLQFIELVGGTRRSENHLSWCDSNSGLKILAWSTSSLEPAPWSPVGEDRANLHLYQINGNHMNLLCYHQLENDTLSADISQVQDNLVHIVEQITYQINGVNLDWIRYEIPNEDGCRKLMTSRESITQVWLSAPAKAVRRSPCDSRLLIGCIDGSLHVVHKHCGLTHTTWAGFIATSVCWMGDLIAAVEEHGRIQCFDRALSLLQHHSKCIDISQHLSENRRMSEVTWRRSRGGCAVLAKFIGGPLAILRIIHPRLSIGWIRSGRPSRTLALLRSLDWNTEGEECLFSLQELVYSVLRRTLNAENEAIAQAALGTYLAPQIPIELQAQKYAPVVHDLARKFFHHLLRRGRLDKALSLAVDLCDWDLFADARWMALRCGRQAIADEAQSLALQYAATEDSSCSASCSQCSSRASSYTSSEEEEVNTKNNHVKAPPLPRVPLPPRPTIMPVPITTNEPISTNSIRPNLHQYLERDLTIWNIDAQPILKNTLYQADGTLKWHTDLPLHTFQEQKRIQPNHSVVDVIPRPRDEKLGASRFGKVYQKELPEEVPSPMTNMFRYHSDMSITTLKHERNGPEPHRLKQNGEKNKVKFSDTVTIAVMSEEPRASPCRILSESVPHLPSATTSGTALDYVEV